MKYQDRLSLPYIENQSTITFICVINLAAAFLFFYGQKHILLYDIFIDAVVCSFITSFICVYRTRKVFSKNAENTEEKKTARYNDLIKKLPENSFLLSLSLAVIFSIIIILFVYAVSVIYQFDSINFPRFTVWKIFYSCLMAIKIVELAVLKYADTATQAASKTGELQLKNPLPKVETFRNFLNTVISDFGTNILFGLLFGGVIIEKHNVILLPAKLSGIIISGAIFGAIILAMMVYPISKAIWNLHLSKPEIKKKTGETSFPANPLQFTLLTAFPLIILSPLFFAAVFMFFGFEQMNFLQFFFVRFIYITLLTKPIVAFAIYFRKKLG